MKKWYLVCFLLTISLSWIAQAQQSDSEPPKVVPKVVPVPVPKGRLLIEPTTPAAQTFVDAREHLSLRVPAGWKLSRRDGEVSTFHMDARTAPKTAQVRAVASIAYNPFPQSTFSGALLYFSVVPHVTPAACAEEAKQKPAKPLASLPVADVSFSRGLDEHGTICTEGRDVAYTAMHAGTCLRFDLAVNTFCGGEVSGAKDMSNGELANIFRRMEDMLESVKFEK